jgi:hypothetical protein
MITKTEVLEAISNCERHAGFATIDKTLVRPDAIRRGDLYALIEAAKCARYKQIDPTYNASSDACVSLDYEQPYVGGYRETEE